MATEPRVIPHHYVVDTDVVSDLLRGDSRATSYDELLTGARAAISFMAVAELDRWALSRNWGPARRRQLAAHGDHFVVVIVDRGLCRTWASVTDAAQRKGRVVQNADAWIAATAIAFDVPLLTNNRADFLGIDGLRLAPERSS